MYHIFFIHSSVGGHLGCFHDLAIVNSAAMNIGADTLFQSTPGGSISVKKEMTNKIGSEYLIMVYCCLQIMILKLYFSNIWKQNSTPAVLTYIGHRIYPHSYKLLRMPKELLFILIISVNIYHVKN